MIQKPVDQEQLATKPSDSGGKATFFQKVPIESRRLQRLTCLTVRMPRQYTPAITANLTLAFPKV